jgi:hypothetical protein
MRHTSNLDTSSLDVKWGVRVGWRIPNRQFVDSSDLGYLDAKAFLKT